jgi:hypothetical protein
MEHFVTFSVTNRVFPVSGNKINSLLLDDQSLRFTKIEDQDHLQEPFKILQRMRIQFL